jgi:hypothetical protein
LYCSATRLHDVLRCCLSSKSIERRAARGDKLPRLDLAWAKRACRVVSHVGRLLITRHLESRNRSSFQPRFRVSTSVLETPQLQGEGSPWSKPRSTAQSLINHPEEASYVPHCNYILALVRIYPAQRRVQLLSHNASRPSLQLHTCNCHLTISVHYRDDIPYLD